MSKKKNSHTEDDAAAVPPVSMWINEGSKESDNFFNEYSKWWMTFYKTIHDRKVKSKDVIRAALGESNYTVTYSHRNDVWRMNEEGWVLFVDVRGPAFHVTKHMTCEEAFAAFQRFAKRIDMWLSAN